MDGFWALLVWSALCISISAGVGHYSAANNIADECTKKNEFIAGNRVISCKPVALVYEGRRLPLKEQQ